MNKIWLKMKNFIILAGYQHGTEMSRLALRIPSQCDVQPIFFGECMSIASIRTFRRTQNFVS